MFWPDLALLCENHKVLVWSQLQLCTKSGKSPQLSPRPAILTRKAYNNRLEAQNQEQLRPRISEKIREINAGVVQRMMQRVRGKLMQIEDNGPLSIIRTLGGNKNS
ncbi:unnamed protein product [Psylliodes chrysocephalus]|uniref:Uncharacterized protein n=1 Tax=Psylliodes chrysocephalus TaxID=3402493 RepID=A0A9P0GHA4_9CUCU|nr:unnamed protein product [Psylliodes chrysocephala]